VWIPPGLGVDDPRQQGLIQRLRADSRAPQASDLLETPFEDLRAAINDALERGRAPQAPRPAPPAAVARVYLLYDDRDSSAVAPWADFLFDHGFEVIPSVFTGDEAQVREYHEENLRTADGVVIFYGAANELWLRRKFSELQKIAGYGRTKPAPAVAVCLLSPKTPEKERFRTHEALVIPQFDGLSPDSWTPIVSRLKG